MPSDEVKKELDKYNQEKKTSYKSACHRMAKVHEQDHDNDDKPDNPEPDLDNHHPNDSYPMQDSDIEELFEKHMSILSQNGITLSYLKGL